MSNYTLTARLARRFPDPTIENVNRHILFCRVEDLPQGLPLTPNPREQNVDRGIWRDIKDHLLNEEGTHNSFHLKNKGITLIASSLEKLDDEHYKIRFEDGEGIVDGGHTYRLIMDNLAEIAQYNEDADGLVDQYVKVEVLTGLDQGLITEIAGGLNTAIQVQQYSLANLNNEFDWIKAALANKPYLKEIAFRENEGGTYDVRYIVSLLDLFNIVSFPNEKTEHPVRAYSSKSKVLDFFIKHSDQYRRLATLLPDILEFHDTVSSEARDLHNATGKGKAGKLAFMEKKQRGKHHFVFINQESEYWLNRGALFPMMAAFRWLVKSDSDDNMQWDGGFERVKSLWRQVGGELMRATQDTSDELGRRANAIGRSKRHWSELHNIVCKRMMLQAQ